MGQCSNCLLPGKKNEKSKTAYLLKQINIYMEPEEVQKVFNEANMDKTEVMTTKRLTLGFQNFLSNHLIVSLSECPSVIFEAGRLSI